MTECGYDAIVARIEANSIHRPTVVRELMRGKSVLRATFNSRIDGTPIYGDVLDLGARNRSSSYYRFLDSSRANKITFCDYEPKDEGMVQVDLEKPLPFPDKSYDVVMLLFVLGHIWNVLPLIREMRRVSRGSVLIGTNFVDQFTPEPHDYMRFTSEGLDRLFHEAGSVRHKVFSVGQGPLTLALSSVQHTRLCPVAATLYYPFACVVDALIARAMPQRTEQRCVMTHIGVLDCRGE
ncbi:hypothetical protein CCP2SC5_80005 [Azospirillaceae bacterium]